METFNAIFKSKMNSLVNISRTITNSCFLARNWWIFLLKYKIIKIYCFLNSKTICKSHIAKKHIQPSAKWQILCSEESKASCWQNSFIKWHHLALYINKHTTGKRNIMLSECEEILTYSWMKHTKWESVLNIYAGKDIYSITYYDIHFQTPKL